MQIEILPDYFRWANQRTFAAIDRSSPNYLKQISLMAHLLAAETIWLSRLRGQLPSISVWPQGDDQDFSNQIEANASGYAKFIFELGSQDPLVVYQNSKGEQFENSARGIIAHVFPHGAYHRGQIAALVKASGSAPPITDYIVFLRERKTD